VRASLNQRLKNALQDCFSSLQNFVIPESNHTIPAARQPLRTFEIFQQMVRVLPTVEFHDQARPHANEIDHESSDGCLTAESIAAQPSISQVVPEAPFGIGRGRA